MQDFQFYSILYLNLLMNFCIQHGKCLHCCSWKPLISVWGYPQYPKRCTKVLLSTFEIAIFTTHIHYYPLEMHFNFLFFFFFLNQEAQIPFPLNTKHGLRMVENVENFWGVFPPFIQTHPGRKCIWTHFTRTCFITMKNSFLFQVYDILW